jgi:hypothetical protein
MVGEMRGMIGAGSECQNGGGEERLGAGKAREGKRGEAGKNVAEGNASQLWGTRCGWGLPSRVLLATQKQIKKSKKAISNSLNTNTHTLTLKVYIDSYNNSTRAEELPPTCTSRSGNSLQSELHART